ncbi:YoaK family protein [Acidiphilium acidophilum]|uniref:YoaK family protein n=1 Tax=Acidiphilium acidophilum TaxID=76588 RepID=A0AAW9DUS3_ACIAO|nr:YoaK family protein [Acidiphilium acidophilum]MDX5932818.1 YoaK family protein [Acidiphilium acidophilum]GBR75233.1 hypothetical protein AA700_0435 [Acidiphilium acidophilum DSM 700]
MEQAAADNAGIAGTGVTLLCFASGATDVLSYLTLGHVFTSAMTGCMALFCLTLINRKFAAASRAGASLLSYAVGSAAATLLQPRDPAKVRTLPVVRRLLLAETLSLAVYCTVSLLVDHPFAGAARYGLIVLSATAMGIQAVAARDIHERGIITVVLNITITSVVIALTRRLTNRGLAHLPAHNRLQGIVILGYAAGALASAGAFVSGFASPGLLPLAAVLLTLIMFTISGVQHA